MFVSQNKNPLPWFTFARKIRLDKIERIAKLRRSQSPPLFAG